MAYPEQGAEYQRKPPHWVDKGAGNETKRQADPTAENLKSQGLVPPDAPGKDR